MKWCSSCKEVLEDEHCSVATDWYEAWGQEFSINTYICPSCGMAVDDYEGQDEEEEMEEIRDIVDETTQEICNKFCKFAGTGDDGHCIWCQTHEDKCPLDDLMRKVGLI